jgi:hypothetical protein
MGWKFDLKEDMLKIDDIPVVCSGGFRGRDPCRARRPALFQQMEKKYTMLNSSRLLYSYTSHIRVSRRTTATTAFGLLIRLLERKDRLNSAAPSLSILPGKLGNIKVLLEHPL